MCNFQRTYSFYSCLHITSSFSCSTSSLTAVSSGHSAFDSSYCLPIAKLVERLGLSKLNRINTHLETFEQVLKNIFSTSQTSCWSRFLHRKEVIQPQVLLRLPCYDFTPIADPTLGRCLLAVSSRTLGIANSHGVTGGVYKARERIHRDILIRDY